jgi:hypothetical protein
MRERVVVVGRRARKERSRFWFNGAKDDEVYDDES